MNDRKVIWVLGVILAVLILGLTTGNMLAKSPIFIAKIVGGASVVALILYRGIKPLDLNPYQYCFFCSYLLALLLGYSPSKTLGYLGPMASVVIFMGYMLVKKERYVINQFMKFFFGWVLLTLLYRGLNEELIPQNSVIAFLTYSSFIPLFLVPSRKLVGGSLFPRMVRFTAIIVLCEALIGFVQGMYGYVFKPGGTPGDYVEGTLHIFLAPSSSLSNPMFCYNIMFGIVVLLVFSFHFKKKIPKGVYLGLIVFGMATVVHLALVWALAIGSAFFIVRPKIIAKGRTTIFYPMLAVLMIIGMTVVVFKSGAGHVGSRWENYQRGGNYKAMMFNLLITDLPEKHPVTFIFGAGPGQFGSRAAAIGAGYLGNLPPGFKYVSPPLFREYLLDMWINWIGTWWRSAVNSPESSWFAILSEEGILGFMILIGVMTRSSIKAILHSVRNPSRKVYCFGYLSCIFAIFLSGFSSFYWEVPQAIFMGCLAAKLFHAEMYFGDA